MNTLPGLPALRNRSTSPIFVGPNLELFRAFSIFGAILVVLGAIWSRLAFHDLNLRGLSAQLHVGQSEAERIAATVIRLGGGGLTVDFDRVREQQEVLRRLIQERISARYVIHHVEVCDQAGGSQLFVSRENAPAAPSEQDEQLVTVQLKPDAGFVRVGLSQGPMQEELEALQRKLQWKMTAASVLALVVLVGGLFYVLYLIRKNRMLERARESAERASYVGLLASQLAHDIRNPLNAMNMNLQMLEEDVRGCAELRAGEALKSLELIQSEIKRLERLVNDFLAYARPVPPRFESHDVNAVIDETVRLLDADFRQHRVELLAELEPLLPRVELDETQFKQVLLNLLVNARQVLRDGGRVRVRTRAGASGEIVVEIEDNGPGIPAAMRERIFEVFYSSRGGGTGLGLPIARQIIERHGGRIEVDSVEGQGATFRIRLPRRQPPPVRPQPALEGAVP
ncbi:MAG TPA: ATP-binding protein [Candidatus Polarisedimenticolaceae bacterium]|nr:ATP-binding protein [Candidatus Polarisedimenticolaceae bacterium]